MYGVRQIFCKFESREDRSDFSLCISHVWTRISACKLPILNFRCASSSIPPPVKAPSAISTTFTLTRRSLLDAARGAALLSGMSNPVSNFFPELSSLINFCVCKIVWWKHNSSNVAPKHLLNIKTVSERRENMLWFRVPPKVYFKPGCLEVQIHSQFSLHMLKFFSKVCQRLQVNQIQIYFVDCILYIGCTAGIQKQEENFCRHW